VAAAWRLSGTGDPRGNRDKKIRNHIRGLNALDVTAEDICAALGITAEDIPSAGHAA
jgi:hypothetical protein